MAGITLCNGKFEINDTRLIDPRSDRADIPAPNETITDNDSDRLAGLIAASFSDPIDFPPISQAVMTEDSVAIAVEPDTPGGLKVARLVADWLVAHGNKRDQITILCSERQVESTTTHPLQDEEKDYILHDATNADDMAMLVIDKQGVPLHVNRVLFDADIVIPVGTGDGGRDKGQLCPAFCSLETKQYIKGLRPSDAAAIARMIDSNLGVFWQVRLITAPGEHVLEIATGASEQVLEQSAKRGNESWNVQIDRPFEMVLATIESASSQSWANLRSAILAADKATSPTAEDASLVIFTDLAGKPPSTWPTPGNADNRDGELADIFHRRHVYLASRLTQDSTENFGFGYLDNAKQIQKLINQHESCLLLRDAHRAGLQIREAV